MLRWNATRKFAARMQLHGLAEDSTVPGLQKLAKELRARESWWYHFRHPDMPVERIHPSRRMLLPCKPLPFVVIPIRWAAVTGTHFSVTPSSLGVLGFAEPRVPSVLAPAPPPPPWGGLKIRPPVPARGCLYTHEHEGAPVRGDGRGSPLVERCNQFPTSYYHLVSSRLCRAHDPLGCQLAGSIETPCLMKFLNFRKFTPDD